MAYLVRDYHAMENTHEFMVFIPLFIRHLGLPVSPFFPWPP
jgi:hypothetical protein